MLVTALCVLPLLSTAAASPTRRDPHDHDHLHDVAKRLPSAWFHDADHPVHALFKRDSATTDGITYASVGSPAWSSAYPASTPNVNALPAAWTAALNDAVARKVIPDIPLSKNTTDDGSPVYPTGTDPTSPEICSATYQCRIPGDVWDGPAGVLALSFDDGPEAGTPSLLPFLQSQNQTATHFMIGSNILNTPDEFMQAFNLSHDIAVHTWTHPHMTTQSNLQVVAELGWTMEIIHNSTGGRVPKFWRPPYGDSDMRTRAIAKEVFGLTTVVWNQDTEDWSLSDSPPGTTPQKVNASLTKWLTGPKSPGLVILEHELSVASVKSFIAAYPVMKSNGWDVVSLAQAVGNASDGGAAAYQNAASDTSPVNAVDIIDAKSVGLPVSSSSVASSSSPPTGSQTGGSATPSSSSSSTSKPNTASRSLNRATGATALLSAIGLLFLCI
ncbi:carbohydrate esterase family 4 protein [Mycena filopes]|nr:carbohydrate esterase family 4 protein [Mycena filopes]